MNNDGRLPDEAAPEVVEETAVGAAEATEALEATEADGSTAEAVEGESPTPSEEEASESKKRRERRKAYVKDLEQKKADSERRLQRIREAGEADEAPNEDDFDDLTEYAAAKAVWGASQKSVQRETAQVQAERDELVQIAQREVEANWVDAQAEARTRLQNFDQVITNPNAPITDPMVQVIKSSDVGADIAYYLGSNPSQAMRIASLSVNEQVFELGRIAASVTTPKPILQSNAPDPIRPVGAPARTQKDPAKMSMAEYTAWREKGGG